MKKRSFILALAAAMFCAVGLSACSHTDEEKKPEQTVTPDELYARVVDLGFSGSLEEFIEMLKGKDGVDDKDGSDGADGQDGRGILSVTAER